MYLYLLLYIMFITLPSPLKMICPQSILMEDLSLALSCNIVSLFFIHELVIVENLK
jgi:hypothetical protein